MTKRSDTIPNDELWDVAQVAQHWYSGQRDPVYALVSSVMAGHDVPLGIAEDALHNLTKDYRTTQDPELAEAITSLEWAILEARSRAARMPNPLSMGRSEAWGIGLGLAAGVGALCYYAAKALGSSIAKAAGNATPGA
jgi:hypothetical protein